MIKWIKNLFNRKSTEPTKDPIKNDYLSCMECGEPMSQKCSCHKRENLVVKMAEEAPHLCMMLTAALNSKSGAVIGTVDNKGELQIKEVRKENDREN